MKPDRAIPALCLGAVVLWSAATLAQTPARRTTDGVFSAEQAARGEAAFRACTYCHGRDLRGGDDPPGPALKGEIFLAKWRDRPVLDLFELIAGTMPRDRPATLEPQAYADILAYLLAANGMPSGGRDLSPDPDTLRDIRLAANPIGSR